MRRLVGNIAAATISTIVVVLFCELITRGTRPELLVGHDERVAFCEYDPELGWRNRPHASGRFAHTSVVHDAEGRRDVEVPSAPLENRRRVIVLGDSFTWGYLVNAEDSYTDLINQRLQDVDVVNLGCSGYGTDQEYLLLKREFARRKPDLAVIAVHVASDIYNNRYSFQYGYHKPYFELEGDDLVLKNVPVPKDSLGTRINKYLTGRSALWNVIADRMISGETFRARFVGWLDEMTEDTETRPTVSRTPASALICRLSQEIALYVGGQNSKVLFMLIPDVPANERTIKVSTDYDKLRQCLQESNIPMLDLEPVVERFFNERPMGLMTFKWDRHWSRDGHKVASDALQERIEEIFSPSSAP